jgi:glycerate kinase
MDHAGFAAALAGTDLCITAEGRIDMSTLGGKVVVRVAERCAAAAVACIAVGGGVDVAAANELRKLGCDSLEQGDLEHAGYQLGNRHA